jgi:hypothetical protein
MLKRLVCITYGKKLIIINVDVLAVHW